MGEPLSREGMETCHGCCTVLVPSFILGIETTFPFRQDTNMEILLLCLGPLQDYIMGEWRGRIALWGRFIGKERPRSVVSGSRGYGGKRSSSSRRARDRTARTKRGI